jgi:hypothetical protein
MGNSRLHIRPIRWGGENGRSLEAVGSSSNSLSDLVHRERNGSIREPTEIDRGDCQQPESCDVVHLTDIPQLRAEEYARDHDGSETVVSPPAGRTFFRLCAI